MIILWVTLTGAGATWIGLEFRSARRTAFLPGRTSDGHYQIEIACDVCHTPMMGVRTESCVECHGAELTAANDSHPRAKFTDPRNADRVALLDARECITCHVEHRPEITGPAGETLPLDHCRMCHAEIAAERPSHAGAEFKTCSTSGCHNFHDNRALYEDFLLDHAHEPALLSGGRLPLRDTTVLLAAFGLPESRAGEVAADRPSHAEITADAPQGKRTGDIERDWLASAHAAAGVNCSDCHGGGASARTAGQADWSDTVTIESCRECHESQADGFLSGRHGMRLAQGLSPMTPAMARRPMKAEAAHLELTCGSCHPAHGYDTRAAAANSCLKCHDDAHSRAWEGSAHARLWADERSGAGEPGSGVSCASCHLPRVSVVARDGEKRIATQHNQNDNLRPNEKMARDVCMKCHGLGFTLDALADPARIADNFSSRPGVSIPGIEWATARAAGRGKAEEGAGVQ